MASMTDEAAVSLLRRRQERADQRAAEAVEFAETLYEVWPGARLVGMRIFLLRAGTMDRFRATLKLERDGATQTREGRGNTPHLAVMDALQGRAAEELPF